MNNEKLTEEEYLNVPEYVKERCRKAIGDNEHYFALGISVKDCTGCGLCIKTCPGMRGNKALMFSSLTDELKNKEQAMKLLKSKLYKLEEEKNNSMINDIKDTSSDINFGSQIRSYVLEPYKLVKDNRSGYESTNPTKILDGYLDDLINSVLRANRG